MATTALAQTCATCLFGAISSQTLSFTAHVLETITVSVIPHVTVFTNGSAPTTSYQSITITQDIVQPTGTGTANFPPATYTDEADITWTVSDATLTYPTTYIRYLAFDLETVTSFDSQQCPQPMSTAMPTLPHSLDVASLIYPVSNETANMLLPSPLLEYLNVVGCAPLPSTSTLPSFVLATPTTTTTTTAVQKRFEGPRRADSQLPIVTPIYQPGNDTLERRQYGSGTAAPSGTAPYAASPIPTEQSSVPESSAEPSAYNGNSETTALGSLIATATHTTAYVISAVTGPAIVTTLNAPQSPLVPVSPYEATVPTSVTPAEHNPAPQTTPTPSNPPNHQPVPDNVSQTPEVSGLLGGIGSVATKSAEATPSAAGPEVSGLLGNLGSVAAAATKSPGYTAPTESPETEHGSTPLQTTSPPQHGNSGPQESSQPKPVFSAGSTVISTSQDGQYYYGNHPLSPGSTIIFGSGPTATLVGLQTSGDSTQLVVGGSTYTAEPTGALMTASGSASSNAVPVSASAATVQAVVTEPSDTFTAVAVGSSIILQEASSTASVKDGSTVEFEGHTVSAMPSGTAIVVDATSTITLSTGTGVTSSSTGIGGYIHSGLGPATISTAGPSSSSTAGAAASSSSKSGAASRYTIVSLGVVLSCICGILGAWVMM